ncbi:MAG: hypothetical protein AAF804_01880, partial [Bacteroidota bacterium]
APERAMLAYLASPLLRESGLMEAVLGPELRIEQLDRRSGRLYWSLPRVADSALVKSLSVQPDSLKWGLDVAGLSTLGKIWLRDSQRVLVQMPVKDFQLDSLKSYEIGLPEGLSYRFSAQELRDLLRAYALYNGPAIFSWEGPEGKTSIANHMAPVARGGEPTLSKLIEDMFPDSLAQEEKVQALLAFVSDDIEYEFHGQREIFMKPHETILAGRSDCSGKVVLFASLLEQIEQPYLLVYLDNHICVGVTGDYPEDNQLHFDHQGETYYVAETTAEGFKIGSTELYDSYTPDDFLFLQAPGTNSKLYDLVAKDSVDFLTVEVSVSQ